MADQSDYVSELCKSNENLWTRYALRIAGGYGWQYMLDSADYLRSSDLRDTGTITATPSPGASPQEFLPQVTAAGGLGKCPALQAEMAMLSVGGHSGMLKGPVMVRWFNQTNILQILTLSELEDQQIRDYANHLIRRDFPAPPPAEPAPPTTKPVPPKIPYVKPHKTPEPLNTGRTGRSSAWILIALGVITLCFFVWLPFLDNVSLTFALLELLLPVGFLYYGISSYRNAGGTWLNLAIGICSILAYGTAFCTFAVLTDIAAGGEMEDLFLPLILFGTAAVALFVTRFLLRKRRTALEPKAPAPKAPEAKAPVLKTPAPSIPKSEPDCYYLVIYADAKGQAYLDSTNAVTIFPRSDWGILYLEKLGDRRLGLRKIPAKELPTLAVEWLRLGAEKANHHISPTMFNSVSCSEEAFGTYTLYLGTRVAALLRRLTQGDTDVSEAALSHRLTATPLLVPFCYDNEPLDTVEPHPMLHMTDAAREQFSSARLDKTGKPFDFDYTYLGIRLLTDDHIAAIRAENNVTYYGSAVNIEHMDAMPVKPGIMHPRFADNPVTKRHDVAVFTDLYSLKAMYPNSRIAIFTFEELALLALEGTGMVFNPGLHSYSMDADMIERMVGGASKLFELHPGMVYNPGTWKVVLTQKSTDAANVGVIRALREITHCSLSEAKALCQNAPSLVLGNLSKETALQHVRQIRESGGKAEIRP